MRIVFMGTPGFAVESLKAIVEAGYKVVGVITMPDKKSGRGRKISQSPVKLYAKEQGLTVLQPTNLKNETFLTDLKSLKAHLQVVVAFRMLPEAVWNMPPGGTINLHASLLPNYRGAAPINWVLINGEKVTGNSTFFLQHKIDTGNIIYREEIPITEDDTAGSLHDKLMISGGKLIVKTLKAVEKGNYPKIPQSELFSRESELKTAPKIFKPDCKINWHKPLTELYNFIRGLSPYPAAFAEIQNKNDDTIKNFKVFITKKEEATHSEEVGTILSDNKNFMKIAVNGGFLVIEELQPAGKKRMKTEELLRGFNINDYKLKL